MIDFRENPFSKISEPDRCLIISKKMEINYSTLPTNVVPMHYDVTIRPKLDDFTFAGNQTVNVQICKRTQTIVLNALDIAIQSSCFVSSDREGNPIV